MSKEPWYESSNPDRVMRGGITRGVLILLVLLTVSTLIGVAVWLFGVGTSDLKGKGDAVKQKNSANNRIAAQQTFEDLIADIKASDRKLDQAAADKKAYPTNDIYVVNYAGLVAHCLDTVGRYNADARKYTAAQFKASDLPTEVDITDPTTDCKESK